MKSFFHYYHAFIIIKLLGDLAGQSLKSTMTWQLTPSLLTWKTTSSVKTSCSLPVLLWRMSLRLEA